MLKLRIVVVSPRKRCNVSIENVCQPFYSEDFYLRYNFSNRIVCFCFCNEEQRLQSSRRKPSPAAGQGSRWTNKPSFTDPLSWNTVLYLSGVRCTGRELPGQQRIRQRVQKRALTKVHRQPVVNLVERL